MSSYFDRWRQELLEDFARYADDEMSMVIAAHDWESQLARDVMVCTMHPEFPPLWRDMLLSTLNRMAVFCWSEERGDVGKTWTTRDELKQLLFAELEQLDADFRRVNAWLDAHKLPSFNDPGHARFLWERAADARRAVVGDVRDATTPNVAGEELAAAALRDVVSPSADYLRGRQRGIFDALFNGGTPRFPPFILLGWLLELVDHAKACHRCDKHRQGYRFDPEIGEAGEAVRLAWYRLVDDLKARRAPPEEVTK